MHQIAHAGLVQGRPQRADRRPAASPRAAWSRWPSASATTSSSRPCEELLDAQPPRDEAADRDRDRRGEGQLRGLYLRRRHGLSARTRSNARCGARTAGSCSISPAPIRRSHGVDQLLPQRKHDEDVLRHLHDHGLRSADPVQRRLLRPDRRAHPGRIAAQAATSRRRSPAARMRWAGIFDILGGLLGQKTPEFLNAAGFSSVAASVLFGHRQRRANGSSCSRSASAAFPAGRSATGRTAIRCGPASPTCPTNSSNATSRCVIERYETVPDSGGAGLHRGGNGINMSYRFLEPGMIAIHDDRWFVPPWGVNGGAPGARATQDPARSATARSIDRRQQGGGYAKSRPATCSTSSPGAAAAGAIRWTAIPR